MLTIIWLLVWLFSGTPDVSMWNTWAIALVICFLVDFLGLRK